MGLLKSVDDTSGINFYEYRDNLYYNQYQYRIRFELFGVRYAMYEKTFDKFMDRFNGKRGWKAIEPTTKSLISENLEAIEKFIEIRNKIKEDKTGMVRVEHNTIAIFSNDLSLLKSIENISNFISYDYTQAQTHNYVGVKTFVREPKHKFRIYLKTKIVEGTFIKDLYEFINRSSNLYPCDSLKYWLQTGTSSYPTYSWRYRYTCPTHFIDYDDESTLSYLALMYGDYLGKRYKLEKRPDPV